MDIVDIALSKKYTDDSLAGAGSLKGVSISKVQIDDNGHLIITYDGALPDGTTIQDAGALPNGVYSVEEITTASNVWNIQHNLNTPYNELTIIATDTDNNYIIGDIDEVNSTNNLLVITFSEDVAGKVVVKK